MFLNSTSIKKISGFLYEFITVIQCTEFRTRNSKEFRGSKVNSA
jgi:hypothetical protein